jgi:hypothetical protein
MMKTTLVVVNTTWQICPDHRQRAYASGLFKERPSNLNYGLRAGIEPKSSWSRVS